MRRSFLFALLALVLVALAGGGQLLLRRHRPASAPALAEGALAALGGLRGIAAEVIWFRADRLQGEGRFVELAQLARTLAYLEPHTPEVWSYAAWNMAYNISVMMPTDADRWRWVRAAIELLRDDGLRLNPGSPEICRELALLFEIKLGLDIDSAAAPYRANWREIVRDVRARGAWEELAMDEAEMRRITAETGLSDWEDPLLSAIYWARKGGLADLARQAAMIYRKRRI